MKVLKHQDAIGQAVYDRYRGLPAYEIIERADGYVTLGGGPAVYLSEYPEWPLCEQTVMGDVRGRVLDIGCNAGRHALYLRRQGHAVMGIDASPLAIKTARLRGLTQARVFSITRVGPTLGKFDTLLLLGNNFGLVSNPQRARWLLRRFKRLTPASGRVVIQSTNVHETPDPFERRYQAANRRQGRMAGQIRMRVRYQDLATPWFDFLYVSRPELETIVSSTGWYIMRVHDGPGPIYTAVLGRKS